MSEEQEKGIDLSLGYEEPFTGRPKEVPVILRLLEADAILAECADKLVELYLWEDNDCPGARCQKVRCGLWEILGTLQDTGLDELRRSMDGLPDPGYSTAADEKE